MFWALIYQIDEHMTRLLWVGHDRSEQTLLTGLNSLGERVCSGIRYVCSDMWAPYLAAVRMRLAALHVLDRFHIRQQLNKAVDQVPPVVRLALPLAVLGKLPLSWPSLPEIHSQ